MVISNICGPSAGGDLPVGQLLLRIIFHGELLQPPGGLPGRFSIRRHRPNTTALCRYGAHGFVLRYPPPYTVKHTLSQARGRRPPGAMEVEIFALPGREEKIDVRRGIRLTARQGPRRQCSRCCPTAPGRFSFFLFADGSEHGFSSCSIFVIVWCFHAECLAQMPASSCSSIRRSC